MKALKFIPLIILATYSSCSHKDYPDERLAFSTKYLNLIRPYASGDTLAFENERQQVDTFIITTIDSLIQNTKGFFINQRSYKWISVSYRQWPVNPWKHPTGTNNNTSEVEDNLIFINIYPDSLAEECYISFKRFRGSIEKGTDTLIHKSITANHLTFTDYYEVNNAALDLVKDSTDVKTVYITNNKGITAYQDQKGHWWTRIK